MNAYCQLILQDCLVEEFNDLEQLPQIKIPELAKTAFVNDIKHTEVDERLDYKRCMEGGGKRQKKEKNGAGAQTNAQWSKDEFLFKAVR